MCSLRASLQGINDYAFLSHGAVHCLRSHGYNLELVLIGEGHGFSSIIFPKTRKNYAGGLPPSRNFDAVSGKIFRKDVCSSYENMFLKLLPKHYFQIIRYNFAIFLRQHRTMIVCGLRRQIFRQLV